MAIAADYIGDTRTVSPTAPASCKPSISTKEK
jgi:hypothetical protein